MNRSIKTASMTIAIVSELCKLYDHGLLSLTEAVARSGLKKRTFQRRVKAWREGGEAALIHGNTGHACSFRISEELRNHIVELIREKYWDHGAQLLSEQLAANEDIRISKETARKLIKQAFPNDQEKQKTAREHPLRRRRGAFGELIQIDGCPHYWFGLDNPQACLIGFIDDATSRITAARFFPTETSEGYMIVLLEHMRKYGIPVALYSDRHSVFTSNRDKFSRRESRTQFSRACNALGIDLILAQSPNAKGRVERMFRTLQCRWPQMFRIAGISSIEEANMRIKEFIEKHNARFAIVPVNDRDAHAPIADDQWEQIARICAEWNERVVSKSLTVTLNGTTLQIIDVGQRRWSLMKHPVHVIEYRDGKLEILWHTPEGEDRLLNFKAYPRSTPKTPKVLTATAKTIDAQLNARIEEALHAPNHWIERHNKEGAKGVERLKSRAQKKKQAKELEAKLQALHGLEKTEKILGKK